MKEYGTASDEKLMSLLADGDTGAFNGLYDRYGRRLLYFICRMLNGDEEQAQDILQEVFLTLVEKRNSFRQGNRFSAWIYTIARNKIKNIYRFHAGKTFQTLDAELFFNEADATEWRVDAEKFKQGLNKELSALGEEERSAFWLRFQEGFSVREISDILGCPEGTVHSRLHNIIKKVSGHLSGYKTLLEEAEHG